MKTITIMDGSFNGVFIGQFLRQLTRVFKHFCLRWLANRISEKHGVLASVSDQSETALFSSGGCPQRGTLPSDLIARPDYPPLRLITSLIFTAVPPLDLLSSAASMNAKISIVSSGDTGATPVLKNFIISTTNGA